MTQFFSLTIKPTTWPRLTDEQLRAKLRALLDIGATLFETGWGESQPEPPKVEVRTETVLRYVCAECGYTSSKIGVGVHRKVHERKVHKVEVGP